MLLRTSFHLHAAFRYESIITNTNSKNSAILQVINVISFCFYGQTICNRETISLADVSRIQACKIQEQNGANDTCDPVMESFQGRVDRKSNEFWKFIQPLIHSARGRLNEKWADDLRAIVRYERRKRSMNNGTHAPLAIAPHLIVTSDTISS